MITKIEAIQAVKSLMPLLESVLTCEITVTALMHDPDFGALRLQWDSSTARIIAVRSKLKAPV
jgi:hypothetical protein